MSTLKLISWNVNGIRAVIKKGFAEFIATQDPDIICIQETKAQPGQAEIDLPDYTEYWNSAERKGYAGNAIFTKTPALSVTLDLPATVSYADKYGDANREGRVIAAEFEKFYLVTVYTPNSKQDLTRLEFREKIWDPEFLKYMKQLESKKAVIFCGDLNVAHEEVDLARPESNHGEHGFTDEERQGFTNVVSAGFVDTFRMFTEGNGHYTWWAAFGGARARNVGWRIDYFCVSGALKDNVKKAYILPEVMGSDHCPVVLEMQI